MKHTQEFEQIMMDYAQTCYRVAFALTRNPDDAQELALTTLTSTLPLYAQSGAKMEIKRGLLTALRARYLKYYRRSMPEIVCAL